MNSTLIISSSNNPKFKFLLSLEKSKNRKELGLALVEGEKEIEMALESHNEFQSVFFESNIANPLLIKKIQKLHPKIEWFELSNDLFSKLSYRESSGGIIAIIKPQKRSLESMSFNKNPLILIVEGVEKPGNLGAILRTADACGADAVICCHLPTDLYNPNIIRSSLGTVFTVPVILANNSETQDWLKKHQIKSYCTDLNFASNYHEMNYENACAIIVGTEATGVSEEWLNFCDQKIKIPMLGKIDSMNVSVAAAIILFEAKRQRGFN